MPFATSVYDCVFPKEIDCKAADRARCRAMGAAGREKALRLYDGKVQAAAIRDIYQKILG